MLTTLRFRATCGVVLAAFVLLLSCATATCDVRCSLATLSDDCHAANPDDAMNTSMAMPNHAGAPHCHGRNTSPDAASITRAAATLCLHHAVPALLNNQDDQSQRLTVDLSAVPPTPAALTLLPPAISPAHAIPLARSARPPFASSAVLRV